MNPKLNKPIYAGWYCPKCKLGDFVIYNATQNQIDEHMKTHKLNKPTTTSEKQVPLSKCCKAELTKLPGFTGKPYLGCSKCGKSIVPTPKTQRKPEDKCQACNGDGVWHQEGTIEHPTKTQHKPIVNGWEEEFDQSFISSDEEQTHNAYPFRIYPNAHESVKEFIRSLLSSHQTQLIEETRKAVFMEIIDALPETREVVYKLMKKVIFKLPIK